MGKAIVKTDLAGITKLIQEWCLKNDVTINNSPQNITNKRNSAGTIRYYGHNTFYKATWNCAMSDEGVMIDLIVRPKLYLNIMLKALIFLGLFFCTIMIGEILSKFDHQSALLVGLVCILTIVITRVEIILSRKFSKLENSFWNTAHQIYDYQQLTGTERRTHNCKFELILGISALCTTTYLGAQLMGLYGFVFFALPGIFFLTTTILEYTHEGNLQWHWRLRIIENMASWTLLMMLMLGVFIVLLLIEYLSPLAISRHDHGAFMKDAIRAGHFRSISPTTAESLEKDCYEYFLKIANQKSRFTKAITNPDSYIIYSKDISSKMKFACLLILIILMTAIYFFSIKPFYSLLQKQKIWANITGKKSKDQKPSVPYMSQAWRWSTPTSFRVLILVHFFIGGIINIIATVFCIDALSYLFLGRAIVFNNTANLWSWVFTMYKILFGSIIGQILGGTIVIAVALPVLFLAGTFIRRCVVNILLLSRVLIRFLQDHKNDKMSWLHGYLRQVCAENRLRTPVLFFTEDKEIVVKIRCLPFTNSSIIEISQGTIDLLDSAELKAVIAHELGHIKQGVWKVSILKLLSSLAMFPNYYLTLCLDWAKKEMDADQFALAVTKDPQSLKQALIKISTAQISYSMLVSDSNLGFFNKSFKASLKIFSKRLHSVVISVKFFFGDGLFGYVHPYLSERLEAIETNRV